MDNLQDKAEELAGKVKQAIGDLTDDERLKANGEAQEVKADARREVENASEELAEAETLEAETRS